MGEAITPYNFVPLPEQVVPGEALPRADCYYADRHTGWFDITVKTLTPVYTRAPKQPEEGPNEQPVEFFHRPDGTLVLPGSGLRGMIRSLFEIMTCSRMEFISNQHLYYRTFAATGRLRKAYNDNFQTKNPCRLVAGQLVEEDGEWWLRVRNQPTDPAGSKRGFLAVPIEKAGSSPPGLNTPRRNVQQHPCYRALERRAEFIQENGTPRKVSLLKFVHEFSLFAAEVIDKGSLRGWLIAPGPDVQHRHHYQFILKPRGRSSDDKADRDLKYRVPQKVYDDYLRWGEGAHGQSFEEEAMDVPRKLKKDKPAFALLDPTCMQVTAIGANMMLHLRYDHAIADAAHRGQGSPPPMDMAQAVFGRVREAGLDGKADQVRGRVFFEDAVCQMSKEKALLFPKDQAVVPDVLSSPKPTAGQTYLRQQDPKSLRHWNDADARIRGHKLYWHQPPDAAKDRLHASRPWWIKESQATRIQPIQETVTFTGCVRFENLTPTELGALYASIHLPEGMAHKFGMGKGLGLGSVRVTVTRVILVNHAERFRSLDANAGIHSVTDPELRRAYWTFVRTVQGEEATTLWSAGRMMELAALLRSEPPLLPEAARQVGVEDSLTATPLRLADDLARYRQNVKLAPPQYGWLWDRLGTDVREMIEQLQPMPLSPELQAAASATVAANLKPPYARLDRESDSDELCRQLSGVVKSLISGPRLDAVTELKPLVTDDVQKLYKEADEESDSRKKLGKIRKANQQLLDEAFPPDSRQWKDRWPLAEAAAWLRDLVGSWQPIDICPQALDVALPVE